LLLLTCAALAECPAPTSAAELDSERQRAEFAWVEMDDAAFREHADAVNSALPCVGDALLSEQIAGYFRVRGLVAFLDGDREAAAIEFRAAAAIDPEYEFSAELVPEAHPVRGLYEDSRVVEDLHVRLPDPADVWLQIDGRRALEAPSGRPWVVQLFDPDGRVEDTHRMEAGGVPEYRRAEKVHLDWHAIGLDKRARIWRTRGRVAAGGGYALAGIGIVGVAVGCWDPGFSPSCAVPSVAVGAGAVGLLAGVPMLNGAALRERRLLADVGALVPRGWSNASWILYGVSIPAMAFFPAGMALYAGSLACVTAQIRRNRRTYPGLQGGPAVARHRPRLSVSPQMGDGQTGVRLSLVGW